MSEDDTTYPDNNPFYVTAPDGRTVRLEAIGEPFRGSLTRAMNGPDITVADMTDQQLKSLADQIDQERRGRQCQEFLPGHQPCDQGAGPHDAHGYTMWRHDGRGKIRITWREEDDQKQP